jgi:Effector Associated Constant Component 1
MSETVLRIDVGGSPDAYFLRSRLRGVPDLHVEDLPRRELRAEDSWWRSGLRIRLGSVQVVPVLAQALGTWLSSRKGIATLRIIFADGKTVELNAGATVEEVSRLIESALTPVDHEPQGDDPAPGSKEPANSDDDSPRRERAEMLREHRAEMDWELRELKLQELNLGRERLLDDYIRSLPAGQLRRLIDGFTRNGKAAQATVPVTIYLSDERVHGQVEAAVDDLLDTAGLRIEDRDDPVIGSWFRRMRATLKDVMRSPAVREGTLVAAHAVDTRLVLAQDAAVTATMMQNLGPVITSLQPTKDAVVRVGALLIVKVDWAVKVFQLTAAQQAVLDHRPQLDRSPHDIVAALNLEASNPEEDGPLSLQ